MALLTNARFDLRSLLNIQHIQQLCDAFYQLNKTAVAILDVHQNSIAHSGYNEMCSIFHKSYKNTNKLCIERNAYVANKIQYGERIEYKCKSGLYEIAYPIIINNELAGTAFIGQFFLKDDIPDEAYYKKLAMEGGQVFENYTKAMKKVPVFNRSQIENALKLFSIIIDTIAEQGLANLKLQEEIKLRKQAELDLIKSSGERETILNNIRALIFYKDTKNNIIRCTESVAKATGLSREQIEGKHSSLIYPDMADRYFEDDLEVIRNKRPKLGIIEPLMNNLGDIKWLLSDKVPVFDKDKNTIGIVVFCIDVTERIKAENALKEKESNFRHIAEKSPTAIMIYQNSKWVYVNKAATQITEYSELELFAQHFSDVVHPDDKQLVKLNGEKRQKGLLDVPENYEFRIISKNGKIKWVNLTGSNTIFNGQTAGIISVIDISERKKVELELRKGEEKLQQYFDHSPIPIFISSLKGKYKYANKAALNTFGYSKNELKNISIPSIVSPNDLKSAILALGKLITKNKAKNVKCSFKCKDGSFKKLNIDAIITANSEIISFCKDITDISEYQNKLIDSKEVAEKNLAKANSLINAIPDIIFIFDTEGTYKECYVQNDDELFLKKEELLERKLGDILPADTALLFNSTINEVIQTKKTRQFVYELKVPKGSETYQARMAYMDNERVLTIVRNITEDVELLRDLNSSKQKAEESDRLKSTFLTNLSHEIRTPLNGIMGFAELLQENLEEDSSMLEYAKYIKESGENLLNTVNNIIDISFIKTKQINIKPVYFNLFDWVKEVYYDYSNKAGEYSNINFRYSLPHEQKAWDILQDKYNLSKVAHKLLDNAFKYCDSGCIEIGLKTIDLQTVRFYVMDEGVGISDDIKLRMFDYFTNFDERHHDNLDGLGLGLPIAQGMLNTLGYNLKHADNKPSGCIFYFDISI